MIARSVNAAADVIHRAQVNGAQTAAGIAIALESAQLLVSPEMAHETAAVEAERDALKARVAELLAERHSTNEALDDAVQALRERQTEREALVERMRAGQQWERGRNPELVSENTVSQSELREIFGIPLLPPWDGEAAKCRCDEPDADPYACEAEGCSHEFSELNPFGASGRPVNVASAEVSRACGCGWRTSVWHVDDGSAEEELHGHVTRAHDGVYPKAGA